ncbi:MAG: T9SS type A sorting domain-containing protein [Flavobacteriales bacterium]|nr:T9SS type A sorting domain-containing protein [Flavobacteriales bacterium]
MRIFYTLILLCLFALFSNAQITWNKDTADLATGFETESDIETHNVITVANAGNYRWVRKIVQNCGTVKNAICDKNTCYSEDTDSADFSVTDGESFTMVCHFYPFNKCCTDSVVISLYVYNVDFPNVNSTATYILDLWCASASVNSINNQNLIVSPNPATSMLTLSMKELATASEVVISNAEGKQWNKEIIGNKVDISELNAGIYFITIRNEEKIYTTKFVKL